MSGTGLNYGRRARRRERPPQNIPYSPEKVDLKVPANIMRRPLNLPPMERIKDD